MLIISLRLQLLSVTPLMKKGFLVKVPLVSSDIYVSYRLCLATFRFIDCVGIFNNQIGSYYEDKIPASDKPF